MMVRSTSTMISLLMLLEPPLLLQPPLSPFPETETEEEEEHEDEDDVSWYLRELSPFVSVSSSPIPQVRHLHGPTLSHPHLAFQARAQADQPLAAG
jgi:hypothetical protein